MANLPLNHECSVCDKKYYWCNSCARLKNLTPWKMSVCSEECNTVLKAYKQYQAEEIGDEEFREVLLANGFKGKKVYEPLQKLFDRLTADPEPEVELPLVEESGKWEEEDLGLRELSEPAETGHFSKRNRKNKSSK